MNLEHAKEIIAAEIDYYNQQRLHNAIGYVTPLDKLNGRAEQIQAGRVEKLNLLKVTLAIGNHFLKQT